MDHTQSQIYDIIVVGGGPAGMMAAGRAAECGARVLLLEKNAKLGKKLLITGGGRCNITNAELDVRKMVAKYGPKGKALFGAFSRFGVAETLEFFHTQGLETKVEAEQRAFPKSNKAEDVWKTLVTYMRTGHVTVELNVPVDKILVENNVVTGVRVGKKIYQAKQFIIATGGKSRPETGSTGDGFVWMQEIGHTVDESKAALVPVTTKEQWQKELSGLSFPEAKLTVVQDGKKVQQKTGKLLFAHFGLSGPLVLNMSKALQDLFAYSPVTLVLDVYPNLDAVALDKKVLDVFNVAPNKKIRNNLGDIIPPKMILTLLKLCSIDPEKECNIVTKTERTRLVQQLKNFRLTVTGFLGMDKAITTSGGVNLTEIDFKTAQSKLFSNLYLVGDMLDFDRPSGGFSLQICWTTGYLAGEAAAQTRKPS
ncbi:MAG: NAD(P)/FAD-dependent oxidoreductase [Candidatus Doudnabacteria bacterium]|nr:NAD(P)/FAD-dependent oxidoreductase [Candidatus Doudnabacteria bacterium]